MGMISVRLNKNEDKMLRQLSQFFHTDNSTLIKKSLFEFYENTKDLETIDLFEKKEEQKKISFTTAIEILKD